MMHRLPMDRYVELIANFLVLALMVVQYIVLSQVMLDVEYLHNEIKSLEARQAEVQAETLVRVRSIEQFVDSHVGAMTERLRGE